MEKGEVASAARPPSCSSGPTSCARCSSRARAAAGGSIAARPTRAVGVERADGRRARARGARASRSASAASTPSTTSTSRSTRARSSASSARTAPARRRSSTSSPASSRPTRGAIDAARRRRHRARRPTQRARLGPRPLVPGRPAVPVADRRREHRRRARAAPRGRATSPPPRSRLPTARKAEASVARARRAAHRADGPRRVPRQVRPRAVDRHAAASSTSRACWPPTRRCCCSTSRRRASPSARPRRSARCSQRIQLRDRLRAARHRARHAADHRRSPTSWSPSSSARVVTRGTPAEVLEHPQVVASYLGTDRRGHQPLRRSSTVNDQERAPWTSSQFQEALRHDRRQRQHGHPRQGRRRPPGARRRSAPNGHVLFEDVPGVGKSMLARALGAVDAAPTPTACSARPTCCPATSPARRSSTRKTMKFVVPAGPGVHQRPARRRDQPGDAEDAVGAARGDGRAQRHRRRRDPPAARRRSSCSPRRTRSSRPAPSRCPRRSSTASCSS